MRPWHWMGASTDACNVVVLWTLILMVKIPPGVREACRVLWGLVRVATVTHAAWPTVGCLFWLGFPREF